jgi:hypothetical protein
VFPFESSGHIIHVEKSGRFDVDVVLKSLFMRLGELAMMSVTVSISRLR